MAPSPPWKRFPEQAAKDIERWKKEIELRDRNSAKDVYFAAGGQIYGDKNGKELLFEVARSMKITVTKPISAKRSANTGVLKYTLNPLPPRAVSSFWKARPGFNRETYA